MIKLLFRVPFVPCLIASHTNKQVVGTIYYIILFYFPPFISFFFLFFSPLKKSFGCVLKKNHLGVCFF